MQNRISHRDNTIYFSKWSRKSYAIFSGLSKDIKISRLSVDMCGKALLKLNKHSILFFNTSKILISKIKSLLLKDIEIDILELIQLMDIKIKVETNSFVKGNLYLINI